MSLTSQRLRRLETLAGESFEIAGVPTDELGELLAAYAERERWKLERERWKIALRVHWNAERDALRRLVAGMIPEKRSEYERGLEDRFPLTVELLTPGERGT